MEKDDFRFDKGVIHRSLMTGVVTQAEYARYLKKQACGSGKCATSLHNPGHFRPLPCAVFMPKRKTVTAWRLKN